MPDKYILILPVSSREIRDTILAPLRKTLCECKMENLCAYANSFSIFARNYGEQIDLTLRHYVHYCGHKAQFNDPRDLVRQDYSEHFASSLFVCLMKNDLSSTSKSS